MKNSRAKKPSSSTKATVWKLGSHRLVCGDARGAEFVTKLLGSLKIKAVVTDPPYGALYMQGKKGFAPVKLAKEILNDDISLEPEYVAFTKAWLALAVPHLEKKNGVYIFGEPMIFALKAAMEDVGIRFSQLLVWVKNQSVIGRKDYLLQHEHILVGWYGRHDFKRSKDKSVLFYAKPSKSPYHPTTKPIGLIRHLILNCSGIGDVVYDPFGGSGTTLLACEQLGRRCLMVEQDPEYCQTIIKRWEQMTKRKAEQL